MSIVFTAYGSMVAGFMLIGLVLFSRSNWAGALSLPSITILTGLIYFYIFPYLFLVGGAETFFGLTLDGLPRAQYALGLYMLGAFAAFIIGKKFWQRDPSQPVPNAATVNHLAVIGLLALIGLALLAKVMVNQLAIGETDEAIAAADSAAGSVAADLRFLNLAFSAMIPLTIYNLIRSKYSLLSLGIMAFVLLLFLLDGFRFRVVILCSAAAISYCYYRNIRPGTVLVSVAMISGMFVSNVIEITRSYGRGLDVDRLDGREVGDLVQGVGAEIGPVFVLTHLTSRASDLIQFDPWIIAVARLIPTFLWPDKPFPDYLSGYAEGFPDANAAVAGIAGTQQAEFFMQFGWVGMPFLSFGFFMLAMLIYSRLARLSPEARLAGMAILPSLFGFYAQQRGYAFQFLCEALFTLFPLFFMHVHFLQKKVTTSRRAWATSA